MATSTPPDFFAPDEDKEQKAAEDASAEAKEENPLIRAHKRDMGYAMPVLKKLLGLKSNGYLTDSVIARMTATLLAGVMVCKTHHSHSMRVRFIPNEDSTNPQTQVKLGTRVFLVVDLSDSVRNGEVVDEAIWINDKREYLGSDHRTWTRLTEDTDVLSLPRVSDTPRGTYIDERDVAVNSLKTAVIEVEKMRRNAATYHYIDKARLDSVVVPLAHEIAETIKTFQS